MSSKSSSRKGGRDTGQREHATDTTARAAFERASHHTQLALSEALAGARALLDAASIGVSGEPATAHASLAEFVRALDTVGDILSGKSPSLRAAALDAVLRAVDSEITRWEERSRSDEDARAVLRAFLGFREFLWEMGVRREPSSNAATSSSPRGSRPARASTSSRGGSAEHAVHKKTAREQADSKKNQRTAPRVQRINIDG
ncbi:MAG: hypothetical protein ACI8W3_003482 [Myxococcota bacterium]